MNCSNYQPLNGVIHRARWVFPVSSPPIVDGGVAVADGLIRAVGRFQDLKPLPGYEIIDHGEGSILPALVNAHTHLELAALRGRLSGEEGFAGWVRDLIPAREKIRPAETEQAIRNALALMQRRGVGLVGDIGNTEIAYELCRKEGLKTVFFREFLGFSQEKAKKAGELLTEMDRTYRADGSLHVAAHAAYTVSAELFSRLKNWAHKHGKMLSIHVGECREEQEFLSRGNGFFRELLQERSAWDNAFRPPGENPVAYLDKLGILDSNTICVHLVHLSEEDMATLATRQVKCCLCPRSNLFLQVGFPKVEKMLTFGLCPALGTDSLASNDSSSILDEMAALRQQVPALPPERILEMATLNGARTLSQEDRWGSLAPGKESRMIFIPGQGANSQEVLENIMDHAQTIPVSWIDQEE